MKTAVVIAAYNEAKHIAAVVKGVRAAGYTWIIVVDDGSRDHTAELAKKAGATVLKHIINCGKGAAMKTGADYAAEEKADVIVFLDGDGQHDPKEIPRFMAEIRAGNDIVFSYRRQARHMPLARRLGRWTLTHAVTALYRVRLQDILCGYRAATRRGYRNVRWHSSGYGVESEMVALTGKHRLRYSQIPINTIYHDRYKGMTVIDGLRILWNLFWWRLFR